MGLQLLRKIQVNVWGCTCARCGHEWESIGDDPPMMCARCKVRNWNSPARPRGRPASVTPEKKKRRG